MTRATEHKNLSVGTRRSPIPHLQADRPGTTDLVPPSDRLVPGLQTHESAQIDADMTVTQLLSSVKELSRIVRENPQIIQGEYVDIALAYKQLGRSLVELETNMPRAAE